jgi:hypothetical protein
LAAAIRRSQATNTAENDAVRLGFGGHQRLHTTPYPTETLS